MRKRLAVLCAAAILLSTGFVCVEPPMPTDEHMLVNKQFALSADYVPADLTVANVRFASGTPFERTQMTAAAAAALENLFAASEKDGITLYAISGYRSYRTQKRIYDNRLSETGLAYVSRYIAKPGESEHQTGLAMDLSDHDTRWLDEDFADTDAYQWLLSHAQEYGFIIRYPADGESVTGYAFEPWHIRYVGDWAEEIQESGLPYETWLSQRPHLTYTRGRLPLIMR